MKVSFLSSLPLNIRFIFKKKKYLWRCGDDGDIYVFYRAPRIGQRIYANDEMMKHIPESFFTDNVWDKIVIDILPAIDCNIILYKKSYNNNISIEANIYTRGSVFARLLNIYIKFNDLIDHKMLAELHNLILSDLILSEGGNVY